MATAAEKAAQRVKEIEEQLKQAKLKAQKAAAAAKSKENKTARQQNERKKYLVGALVQEMMGKDEGYNQQMIRRLNTFLTRSNDRELFGLPTLAETQEQPAAA